jgi:uncharacterized protein YutE (UPF0331/DUF86 family)
MDPQKNIAVFLSEFDYQVDQISNIYEQLETKLMSAGEKPLSTETVESIGYWLHNLYCAYEDLFKIVAGFWENNLTSDGQYHVNLLKRMILKIKDIRPSLLSKESHNALNELRSFRHVFRHAYSYGLDDERVLHLLRKTVAHRSMILNDIADFRNKIDQLTPSD